MSRTQTKKIVKRYAQALQEAEYPFSRIYLFGSHAKGAANKWSDIDVAVISNALQKDQEKNRLRLWKIRRQVDTRIEPHGFTVKDFSSDEDPVVHAIKKTGIRIT